MFHTWQQLSVGQQQVPRRQLHLLIVHVVGLDQQVTDSLLKDPWGREKVTTGLFKCEKCISKARFRRLRLLYSTYQWSVQCCQKWQWQLLALSRLKGRWWQSSAGPRSSEPQCTAFPGSPPDSYTSPTQTTAQKDRKRKKVQLQMVCGDNCMLLWS